MIGSGDENEQCCPTDIEEEPYAVVDTILAYGNHDIACYHQHEGETPSNCLSATSLFKDSDYESQQGQGAYHNGYTHKKVVGYARFLEKG